jgi:GNAT superfamily N-acetyltransferase
VIFGPEPIAGPLLEQVRQALEAGQAEGAFASDRQLPTKDEIFWAGERDAVTALLTCVHDPAGLWLDLLYVRPEHRRQGMATALINAAAASAKARGFTGLSLGSLFGNRTMNAFCVARGFEPTAIIWGRKV